MPILQIKLTAPTGDFTKAMRTIRADEGKAFTISQRQNTQMLVGEQRVAKARNAALTEAVKGSKELKRAHDVEISTLLKLTRIEDIHLKAAERTRKEAERARKQAEKDNRPTSRPSVSGGGSGVASFVAGGIAAVATRETLGRINDAEQAYSDFTETVNKSSAVFKSNGAEILAWSENSAEAFGLSRTSALETASTFGNLFDSMGLGSQNTVTMSKRLVQLAADLSSFHNRDIQDVIQDLQTGIVSDPEPLRKYGVVLNDQVLKAEALRLKLIKDTKGSLDPLVKTQATYSLLLKQTANAEGDRLKTSKEQAGATRTLTASIADLNVKLGKELAPSYKKILGFTTDFVKGLNSIPEDKIELLGQIAPPIALIGAGAGGLFLAAKGVEAFSLAMKTLGAAGPAGLAILVGAGTALAVINAWQKRSEKQIKEAERPAYLDFESKIRANRARVGEINAFAKNRQSTSMPGANSEYLASQGAFLTPGEQAEVDKLSKENSRLLRMTGNQRAAAARGSKAYNSAAPTTPNVVVPVVPPPAPDNSGAKKAAAAAEKLRRENNQADLLNLGTSKSRLSYTFEEALDLLGTSGKGQLPGLSKQLQGLSNKLFDRDVNLANTKFGQSNGGRLALAEQTQELAEAERENTERFKKIAEQVNAAHEKLKDATEAAADQLQKQAEEIKDRRQRDYEDYSKKIDLESKQLAWQIEDTKVTGDLGQRRRALAAMLDNNLRQSGIQFINDLDNGDKNAVLSQEVRVEEINRANREALNELIQEGIAKTFASMPNPASIIGNADKTPMRWQKDRLAVSATLREVFADAGQAAGPEFFKGLLSGDGGDALKAFRTAGGVAGDSFARKLSATLIDRPIQKAFDDLAGKIANGGKLGGRYLYQGASAIYSAAQALAAARKGDNRGLIGGILGAIGGLLIPGVGPVAGFGIGSSLARGDVIGAGLNLAGTGWAERQIGSGFNLGGGSQIPSDAFYGSSDDQLHKSAKTPTRVVNYNYNQYGPINDRQDAERARRGRESELKAALSID